MSVPGFFIISISLNLDPSPDIIRIFFFGTPIFLEIKSIISLLALPSCGGPETFIFILLL